MTEIHRPLSALERLYWICDSFSTLNVISRVRVRGELRPAALGRALGMLQTRHPLLRTAIQHDDGRDPWFVPLTDRPIPLRMVRREGHDQWLHEINEYELVEPVDCAAGPLARAVVISGADDVHDLLVVVPHVIADGTTVVSLAEQWLTLAAGPEAAVRSERPLPPVEELLPEPSSREQAASGRAEQNTPDEAARTRLRPARIEPTTWVPFERRRTRLLHRELEEHQLDALVNAARQHGTTVHGAVTAALVLAAARDARTQNTEDTGNSQNARFAVGSPIDFRAELVPAVRPDEVGSFVATVHSEVEHAQPFWDLARAIITDLTEHRKLGTHLSLVTMLAGRTPQSAADACPLLEFAEAEGPTNLCSSNIGRYEFPDQIGPWRVSDAQFCTGISVNGYFVATVNSSHSRLFWNFTYIADAVPDDRAARLADDCVGTLLTALDEPTPNDP